MQTMLMINQQYSLDFDVDCEQMKTFLFFVVILIDLTLSHDDFFGVSHCKDIPVRYLNCSLNYDCIYGAEEISRCRMLNGTCLNDLNRSVSTFERRYICRYCFLTPLDDLACTSNIACRRQQNFNRYKANCTVADETQLCLGPRAFHRNIECNWTSGHKKSTALFLSIVLGGLGFDRFYLGHIKEAFGKIFSFGGLGIWTLIDAVLIACGYLRPDDGSVYIS